jgi:uncharacterized MAPEG superfamily protein
MHPNLPPELYWLTLTAGFTGLLWVPYLLNRIAEIGTWETLGVPRLKPDVAWADRLMKAHANAVENLVVFAPLAIIVTINGMSSQLTVAASAIYFFARVVHVVAYLAAIPVIRTLGFAAGFLAQMAIALHLLGQLH